MGKLDEEKFAELDQELQAGGESRKKAIDVEKAYFAEHMPELEQLVRWWNIKMDEFNYGRNKFVIKGDYAKSKDGWVVHLYTPPTFGKGLVITHYLGEMWMRHAHESTKILFTAVYVDGKFIREEKNHQKDGLARTQGLMQEFIQKSSNYQDAIPDK